MMVNPIATITLAYDASSIPKLAIRRASQPSLLSLAPSAAFAGAGLHVQTADAILDISQQALLAEGEARQRVADQTVTALSAAYHPRPVGR